MLLIIPAIELLGEHCVRREKNSFQREKKFFDDPVKMAKLWRVQNARALHIHGHDEGETCQRSVLRSICAAVDIPIQLHGGFQDLGDIESAHEDGVYRVVIDVDSTQSLSLVKAAIQEFGPSKTAPRVRAVDGRLQGDLSVSVADVCVDLERAGCRRVFYTDLSETGELESKNLSAYEELGLKLKKTRITAAGGINGFEQLMQLEEMKHAGIDSVVIGSALYENRFPCQQFWCWNYKDDVDLDRFSTAQLSE